MTLDSRGSKYGHKAHVCNGRVVIMQPITEEGGLSRGNLKNLLVNFELSPKKSEVSGELG